MRFTASAGITHTAIPLLGVSTAPKMACKRRDRPDRQWSPYWSGYHSPGIARRLPKRHAVHNVMDKSIEPPTDASAHAPALEFPRSSDSPRRLPGAFVSGGCESTVRASWRRRAGEATTPRRSSWRSAGGSRRAALDEPPRTLPPRFAAFPALPDPRLASPTRSEGQGTRRSPSRAGDVHTAAVRRGATTPQGGPSPLVARGHAGA